jgi:hypothetical protein
MGEATKWQLIRRKEMKKRLDTLCLVALLLGSSSVVFAQDQVTVNNRTLNIEGQMGAATNNQNGSNVVEEVVMDKELQFINSELEKQQTEIKLNKEKTKGFKKLQRSTEKLAEVTEEYIEEKQDAQAQIERYNKKIDCLLKDATAEGCEEFIRGGLGERQTQDEVAVNQSALNKDLEAQASQLEQEVATEDEATDASGSLRFIPVVGAKSFNSDELSLETQFAGGFKIESELNSRVNVGIGLQMVSMDSQLITNDLGGVYNSIYTTGRELGYTNYSLDFYGRYALSEGKRLTPYIGLGLSYNRSKLEYLDNNNNAVIGPVTYANESYINHFLSGNIALGADVNISKGFGLNLQLDYSRGLGSSLTNESAINPTVNADQQRLIDISNEIIGANTLSVAMGLIVEF